MEAIIPVLAGASSLLATGTVLYRCIRPRFPVTVNCHFCDTSTKVPYGNQNCWDCPTCEQYNGFSQDGDYNKPIPAQFAEDLNHPISAEQRPAGNFRSGSESVLCEKCAQNQLLKVKQLANFVPYEETNYDAEVDAYQRNLEHLYRLCRDCQKKVDRSLRKQDEFLHRKLADSGSLARSDLGQDDMSPFAASHFCTLVVPWYVQALRLLIIVSSLVFFSGGLCNITRHSMLWQPNGMLGTFCLRVVGYSAEFGWCLVCATLIANITAIVLAGRERLTGADAAGCFLWLTLVALWSATGEHLLVADELLVLQPVVAMLTSGVSLWCMLRTRYKRAASPTRIRTRRFRPDSSFAPRPSSTSHSVNHQDVFQDVAPAQSEWQNAEAQPEFHDPIDDLETLSIGDPITLHEKGLAMDSPSQRVPSTPLRGSGLSSLQHRPVISPTRFAADKVSDAAASGLGPTPGHRYVRHHSFGLPKNQNKNTAGTNLFQPSNPQKQGLFSSNGSGDCRNIHSNIFTNGGNCFGASKSIFDNHSIHSNDRSIHGIRSVHRTRCVPIRSSNVLDNRSVLSNSGSGFGNRSVHSNSGSVLGNMSVHSNSGANRDLLLSNMALNNNEANDDRASLFSEPQQRQGSHHGNDSNDTSSNSSSLSPSRASTSCPVDSTFSEVSPPQEAEGSEGRSHLCSVLWGVSFLLNLSFFGYIILYLLDNPVMKTLKYMLGITSLGAKLSDLFGVPTDLLY